MTDVERNDASAPSEGERALWYAVGIGLRFRRLLIVVTVLAAVASVGISLMMPKWYQAETRVVLPPRDGTNLLASLGSAASAARSLLGAGGNDFSRYLSILSSRSLREALADSFRLTEVYELTDHPWPREATLKMLGEQTDLVVDKEFGFLSIRVMDRDPERAAAMANFYVNELAARHQALVARGASNTRTYVEARYAESMARRDSILIELESFQRRYGVFDLEAQTRAYFEQLGAMRVSAVQAEVQLEALRNQFGDQNPQVIALDNIVRAANTQFNAALAGREAVLPVPRQEAPAMVRMYADLMLERMLQERILELVAPLREQARFEQQRVQEPVQIVDYAVAPERKAKPKRAFIVVAATVSAPVLTYVLLLLFSLGSTLLPAVQRRYRQFEA